MKFNVWDSEAIQKDLTQLLEIRAKIEEIIDNTTGDVTPDDLPASVVPTSLLYRISVSYEVIYNALQEYQLLKSGNKKNTNGIH